MMLRYYDAINIMRIKQHIKNNKNKFTTLVLEHVMQSYLRSYDIDIK